MSIFRAPNTSPISPKLLVLLLVLTAWVTVSTGAAHASIFSSPRSTVAKPDTIDLLSPNHSSRSSGIAIDSIVMHTTEGGLSGTLSWLQNPASGVSAHFVISPDGDLYQMVDTADKAWHATYYNSRSIGIEMVGYAGDPATWNPSNLNTLVDLLTWLVATYDVPLVNPSGDAYDYPNDTFDAAGIVGHSQVQPWNKGDPGDYFPMNRILATVESRLFPDPALVGDYNGNGLVDAADYTIWADNFNATVDPFDGADGNGDGLIDAADYTVWADNFGNSAALASGAFPIPEPASLALLGLGGLATLGRRRRSA